MSKEFLPYQMPDSSIIPSDSDYWRRHCR